jgi:predicted acylesterase/phospholipase RssA
VLPRPLSKRLIGQWNNLLDTVYRTTLNVRSGEGVFFSNREVYHPRTGEMYSRRIIASCSIPMVYPWTEDEDGELYWDGAGCSAESSEG